MALCVLLARMWQKKKPGQCSRIVVKSNAMDGKGREEKEALWDMEWREREERRGGGLTARFVTVFDPSLLIKRPTLGNRQ